MVTTGGRTRIACAGGAAGVPDVIEIFMSITHLQIEHRAGFKTQDRQPGLERVYLWIEDVVLPVDVFEALFQPELSPSQRLEFLLGPAVPA